MPTKAKKNSQQTKNWRKILTPRIIVCLAGIILLIISAGFLCIFPPLKPVSQTTELSNLDTNERLANGAKLQQTFVSPINADSLGIYLNSYGVFLETGYFDIVVTQGSTEVARHSIDMAQLRNSQFFYIDCALTSGESYDLSLTIGGLEEIDQVAFMTTDAADSGTLTINGVHQTANLVLSYVEHVPDYFAIWYCVFGVVLLASYIVLFISQEAYGK